MTTVGTAISSRLEARFASELALVDDATLVRRCADIEELLTAAESGAITVAAVSPDFPGMSGSVIAELTMRGANVLGVTSPTSPLDERQCEAWSLRQTHVVGSGLLEAELRALHHAAVPIGVGSVATAAAGPEGTASELPVDVAQGDAQGRAEPTESAATAQIVMVWGPHGSPGRTTCATHLARELAASGTTLLLDADTTAPSCAAHLGLLDEAPGILAAARLVDAGTFNAHQLRSIAAHVDDGFDVLSGIGHAGRWHELTRFHLARILDVAATSYRWIVVDVAADLHADESLLFDTLAPARNAAGLEVMERADVVLALASADPVSLQRFVQQGGEVLGAHPDVRVVVSRARDAAVGGHASTVVTHALERFVGVSPVAVLPDAREAVDGALLTGRLVAPEGRGRDYVLAVKALAVRLGAEPVGVASSRRRRLLRRR